MPRLSRREGLLDGRDEAHRSDRARQCPLLALLHSVARMYMRLRSAPVMGVEHGASE